MATIANIPRRAVSQILVHFWIILISFVQMIFLALIYYFQVGIVRLKQPENLGPGHEETRYIIMVLCPSKEKEGLR